MDIKTYFLLFLIYSVMGWCMETIVCMIESKKFVNRGFLIGPCCPIYGCGGVLITLILNKIYNYPVAVFFSSILLCGTLEYLTSFIMEKLFNARWWDYSKKRFNINGRVCLGTASMFGILSCLILYVTNPLIFKFLSSMTNDVSDILFYSGLSIFIIDCLVSFKVISGLSATVKQVNSTHTSDNTEEITKKVKEILLGKSVFDRRLVKAFPKFSIENVKKKIKETTEQVKENVVKAKESATEHIKEGAAQVKENTIRAKEELTGHIKEGATKVKETTIKAKENTSNFIKNSKSKLKGKDNQK